MSEIEATKEQIQDMVECSDVLLQIVQSMCDENDPTIVLAAIASTFWNVIINMSKTHELISNMRVAESVMETTSNAAKKYILASVSDDAAKRGAFSRA
jgi:hypothetical protein